MLEPILSQKKRLSCSDATRRCNKATTVMGLNVSFWRLQSSATVIQESWLVVVGRELGS